METIATGGEKKQYDYKPPEYTEEDKEKTLKAYTPYPIDKVTLLEPRFTICYIKRNPKKNNEETFHANAHVVFINKKDRYIIFTSSFQVYDSWVGRGKPENQRPTYTQNIDNFVAVWVKKVDDDFVKEIDELNDKICKLEVELAKYKKIVESKPATRGRGRGKKEE